MNPNHRLSLLLPILSFLFATPAHAADPQSIANVCPNSRVLTWPQSQQEMQKRLQEWTQDGRCPTPDTKKRENLKNLIGKLNHEIEKMYDTTETPYSTFSQYAAIDRLLGKTNEGPLSHLGNEVRAYEDDAYPLKDASLVAASDARKALLEAQQSGDEERIQKNSSAYFDRLISTLSQTPTGKKNLSCVEKLQSKTGLNWNGFLTLHEFKKKTGGTQENTDNVGGVLEVRCETTNAPCEGAITINEADPVELTLVNLSHEMAHACGKSVEETMRLSKAKLSKMAKKFTIEGVEGELNFNEVNQLLNATRVLTAPAPPDGVQAPKPTNMVSSELMNRVKICKEGNESKACYSKLMSKLHQTLLDFTRLELNPINQELTYLNSIDEVYAYRASMQQFKELASKEKAFCHRSFAAQSEFGPAVIGYADLYRSWEESKDIDKEILLRLHYLGQFRDANIFQSTTPKHRFSSKYENIQFDKGQAVYTQDYLEYLKRNKNIK